MSQVKQMQSENHTRRLNGFSNSSDFIKYGIDYAKKFGELMAKLEKSCK